MPDIAEEGTNTPHYLICAFAAWIDRLRRHGRICRAGSIRSRLMSDAVAPLEHEAHFFFLLHLIYSARVCKSY